MKTFDGSFSAIHTLLRDDLLRAPEVDVGEWHSQDISGQEHLITKEIQDCSLSFWIPNDHDELAAQIKPNLPWAEEHFLERVGGEPLNPPPSAKNWPYAQAGHDAHTDASGRFSHTYPERMWPKYADGEYHSAEWRRGPGHIGIHFSYGDLQDVVTLLEKSPQTRQAYLPIWFPEDTGAVHGERVPCSLGYHFLIRKRQISCTYMIRSCDFVRHFNDDVYMAARLCQWVREQLSAGKGIDETPPILDVGKLTMHVMSMHIFKGDIPKLERESNVKAK